MFVCISQRVPFFSGLGLHDPDAPPPALGGGRVRLPFHGAVLDAPPPDAGERARSR